MARKAKIKRPAGCHPERETYANDLCGVCYFDATRVPVDPKKKEERQALVAMHQQVTHLKNLYLEAKAILRENLPRYAELHLTAAEIAAADGDARPAEWALQSIPGGKDEGPVATPPAKAGSVGEGGVKVFIGVKIGGLPEQQAAITATTEPDGV